MRVTAVLPCHNHAKWVVDAIDSITNQTKKPDKIFIINNGSTDDSDYSINTVIYDIFTEQHQPEYELTIRKCITSFNIPVIWATTPKPLGPSLARNIGIKYCWKESDVFAFLDTDDIYHPTKIEKSMKLIEKEYNHIGEVYSDYQTINQETGLTIREYKEPFSRGRLLQECIVNCDSLITKKAFETVGLFDENMRCVEDWDLHIRISEYFQILHIPEALVTIRTGSHSSSSIVSKEIWNANWRRVGEKLQERMQRKNLNTGAN